MNYSLNKGSALLEVLLAAMLCSYLITLSLQWQIKATQKAAQQFQELSIINESENALEQAHAHELSSKN